MMTAKKGGNMITVRQDQEDWLEYLQKLVKSDYRHSWHVHDTGEIDDSEHVPGFKVLFEHLGTETYLPAVVYLSNPYHGVMVLGKPFIAGYSRAKIWLDMKGELFELYGGSDENQFMMSLRYQGGVAMETARKKRVA